MISREDIEALAKLARLQLGESEVESLRMDMSSIIDYVGQVSKVATGNRAPAVPAHHNVMREDAPRTLDDALAGKEAAIRAQFPKEENGYNVVRKIIQKDE